MTIYYLFYYPNLLIEKMIPSRNLRNIYENILHHIATLF